MTDPNLIPRLAREAGIDIISKVALQEFLYEPETGLVKRKVDGLRLPAGASVGTLNNEGYLNMRIRGKSVRLHRLAWFLHHGEWPTGDIDHINGDRADNRLVNLRACSQAQNQLNSKLRSDSTSGFKGVSAHYGKWQARIKVQKKCIHLGTFDTAEAASIAYQHAADKYAGEFAFANRHIAQAIREQFKEQP